MPERDADQQRHDERVDGQFQGGRAEGGEHLDDRAAVGDGGAEVAGRQLAEVFEVLHEERPVVAGLVDALRPAAPAGAGRPGRR